MENKTHATLQAHLEDVFGVKAFPYKSLTRAARNLKEIKENFEIGFQKIIRYGIKGQVNIFYRSQGYKSKEVPTGLLFEKGKEKIHVSLAYSDSRTLVSVLEL